MHSAPGSSLCGTVAKVESEESKVRKTGKSKKDSVIPSLIWDPETKNKTKRTFLFCFFLDPVSEHGMTNSFMIGILINIRSAYNVGSIFRTADAAGMEKLYLCGVTPAPIDRFGRKEIKLTKVSLGGENTVAWEKVGSTIDLRPTVKLLEKLKKEGWKLLVIEQSKSSVPYFSMKLKKNDCEKIALIVGHEISGVPRSILNLADQVLEIPMHGKKESLNVSVAFGIVTFSLVH